MGISISKSPNWVPGKGLVFSNQRGGVGGMNMGGNSSGGGAGGGSGGGGVVTPSDIYTKMLLHFDDTVTSSSSISAYYPMAGVASPDGTKVYVGSFGPNAGSQGIHVIDVATGTKTKTISTTGTVIGLVSNSLGTRVYAVNYGSTSASNSGSNVYVIDSVNDTLLSTVSVGSGAHSIAITPDNKFVYASCENSGLYVIDTTATTLTSTQLLTASNAKYAVEVSPDGTKLLVSTGSTVYGYTINPTTGALTLASTLTGFSYAYTSTKNSYYAYFINNGTGSASTVTPISWSTLTKGTNITVGIGPYHGSVSSDGKKLYVPNVSGNTISVINTTTNTVVGTLTGYTSPRDAIIVGSKLFVCDNTTSTISVTDQASFSDVALSPLSQYKFGTVSSSTTQSKFGGKSLYLNGTNTNKLQFANPKTTKMDFSSNNWTIEGWFYSLGKAQYNTLLSLGYNSDASGMALYPDGNDVLSLYYNSGSGWVSSGNSGTLTRNTWNHIAIVRTNSELKMYLNGTKVGTTISVSSFTSNYLWIGRWPFYNGSSSSSFNGYIDGFRVQIGQSVYTSNFTPPTVAPTSDSNTKLLMNFEGSNASNTIVDDSDSSTYVKVVGSAQISTSQFKFGSSSLKITSNSDYVELTNVSQPIALLDRPFCIEGWFYLNANNVGFTPIIRMATSADGQGPAIGLQSNNTLAGLLSTDGSTWGITLSTTTTPTANVWHHVALVRETTAGAIKLYYDGTLLATNNSTSSVTTGENIWVGHEPYYPGGARTLNGYIDEVRIIVGQCAYSAAFTPPTAPFALIST